MHTIPVLVERPYTIDNQNKYIYMEYGCYLENVSYYLYYEKDKK